MTDHQQQLEQLKQQWSEKFPQVEMEPPSERELLKYSQLREQVQNFQQWQQSPRKEDTELCRSGAIPVKAAPSTIAQVTPLSEISEALKTALPWLEKAYETGEKVGLKESNYELLQALGDALTACTAMH